MQLKKSTLERAAKQPLKVGGYLRVSTKEQAQEGDSIPAQRALIEKSVTQWKETVPVDSLEFYEEEGRSGKDLNRPEVMRLQHDIRLDKIDVLMIYKLDRISRNTDDFREIERLLEQHNVELYVINDLYDPTNAQGWFMKHMSVGQAEYERRVTSERTRMGMEYRARAGLWNGGYVYGYRKDPATERLSIHEAEAEVVRRHIYDAFEKLGSVGRVLDHLQRLGIRCPNQRSTKGEPTSYKPFQKQQVRRILEYEVYLGHIIWKDIRTENAHEPIITAEQFRRVRRQLNQNRRSRSNTRYSRGRQSPLKNLIRCTCGQRMTPKGGTGRNRTYHYYECTRRTHQGRRSCGQPAMPAEALERAVISRLRRLGTSQSARERITQEAVKHLQGDAVRLEEQAGLIRQRLTGVQVEINNLLGVLKTLGSNAISSVKDELTRLERERASLRDNLEEIERQKAPADALETQCQQFIEEWSDIGELLDSASLEEQRVILQHLVEVVELACTDKAAKRGTYHLKVFPEIGPLDFNGSENNDGPTPGDAGNQAVLTENGLVRQFDEKAPRVGLEPTT